MTALTADDEYTDSELLALCRQALARGYVAGQTIDLGKGRSLVFASLKDLREQIDWYEERIARAAAASGGGNSNVSGGINFLPTSYSRP